MVVGVLKALALSAGAVALLIGGGLLAGSLVAGSAFPWSANLDRAEGVAQELRSSRTSVAGQDRWSSGALTLHTRAASSSRPFRTRMHTLLRRGGRPIRTEAGTADRVHEELDERAATLAGR
jgi:hypothetical protein